MQKTSSTFDIGITMEEMANIQKVALQALKTFRTTGTAPSKQNIELLKTMMGSITAADVNLTDPSKDRRRSLPGAPPVTHVNIIECPYFSMAVFIVSKGERLPLHDHVGMHGLCKVLYGSIQVEMYDRYNSKENDRTDDSLDKSAPQKFVFHGEQIFNFQSKPCVVTPAYGNYHAIQAVGGSAAFLDILAPPYSSEEGRDCLYYKECPSRKISWREESQVRYLKQIPCPEDFFCDSKPYTGPSVILDDLIKVCDEA